MENYNQKTQLIKARLDDGTIIDIQANRSTSERDIGSRSNEKDKFYEFHEVTAKIESIAQSLKATFDKVKPQNASVEFGLEVGAETGALTAMIVKGTGTAHLTVTLQWSFPKSATTSVGEGHLEA